MARPSPLQERPKEDVRCGDPLSRGRKRSSSFLRLLLSPPCSRTTAQLISSNCVGAIHSRFLHSHVNQVFQRPWWRRHALSAEASPQKTRRLLYPNHRFSDPSITSILGRRMSNLGLLANPFFNSFNPLGYGSDLFCHLVIDRFLSLQNPPTYLTRARRRSQGM
ncbi:hypothetical protein MRB53_023297 [Persea americana]|uniref:Uncharacterized protein n=1 Tax=Persea americana TaxID=3435 RepID=A0ACC2L946_PERAE|nr:hypothetical protein MRB53_023297 [Persea americana]